MTELFSEDGEVYPVTVLNVPRLLITQLKNKEKDGYSAVQIGFGEKKEKKANKADAGRTKDVGIFEGFREVRVADGETVPARGEAIDISVFKSGELVTISAISKGKGFQGVVKRHGFAGGSRTHGQKHSEREPGAIGGGARAGGRVAKGIRMAGRMGSDRVTVQNLKIVKIDLEKRELYLNGAVPGRKGTVVEIKGN